ncbi:MAG: TauD/TfdA family dioxygenase [Xanthomonadales bacterium]|nr:TauD/TfdA family dioxygenase [Xanthomonadales bacterium]
MAIQVTRQLAPSFGAQLDGVQISSNSDDSIIDAVRSLWGEHKLLLFRGQQVSEQDLVDFSRRFGELEIHVRTEYLSPKHPEILYVSNIKDGDKSIGILADTEVGWHYDQIYLARPAVGSLLCAVQLPDEGGNTYFADMAAAYDALDSEIKQKLDGRRATQSYEAFNRAYSVPTNDAQKKRSPDIDHPIIRTHPVTGVKALYLCPGMTTRIVGLDEAESRDLLDFLFEWTVRPEFVYVHRWQPGDCLMWDNACTMHRRDPFDQRFTRLMKRTTILPPPELATPF